VGEPEPIVQRTVDRDPRLLTRLEVNANVMPQEQFQRLVENLRTDGCLTSTPLVYGGGGEYPPGRELILSGNHRCDAAVQAGLEQITVLLVEQQLPADRLLSLQLSHNAIKGQDDPATLKQLYDSIGDMAWRGYAGLDDRTLELLDKVSTEMLADEPLEFQVVQLVFLPSELEQVRRSLSQITAAADERWVAAYRDYGPVVDLLASAHTAYKISDVAAALSIVVGLAERHLGDMQAGFIDPDGNPIHRSRVGLETVFGDRRMPAHAAAVLLRAVRAAEERGDIEPVQQWQLLHRWAQEYLASLGRGQ